MEDAVEDAVALAVAWLVDEVVRRKEGAALRVLRTALSERSLRLRTAFTSAMISLAVSREQLVLPADAARLTAMAKHFARRGDAAFISSSGALQPFLKAAATSPEPAVREQALRAFAFLAVGRQDVKPLLAALDSKHAVAGRSADHRWSAAQAASLLRAMCACTANRPLILALGAHVPLLALAQRQRGPNGADVAADALAVVAALAADPAACAQLGADGGVRQLCAIATASASASLALVASPPSAVASAAAAAAAAASAAEAEPAPPPAAENSAAQPLELALCALARLAAGHDVNIKLVVDHHGLRPAFATLLAPTDGPARAHASQLVLAVAGAPRCARALAAKPHGLELIRCVQRGITRHASHWLPALCAALARLTESEETSALLVGAHAIELNRALQHVLQNSSVAQARVQCMRVVQHLADLEVDNAVSAAAAKPLALAPPAQADGAKSTSPPPPQPAALGGADGAPPVGSPSAATGGASDGAAAADGTPPPALAPPPPLPHAHAPPSALGAMRVDARLLVHCALASAGGELQVGALRALGSLAYHREMRRWLLLDGHLRAVAAVAADAPPPPAGRELRAAAARLLAICGWEAGAEAAGPAYGGLARAAPLLRAPAGLNGGQRGVAILCIDGGGTRGLIALQILRALERQLGGRPLASAFDMICGTSTGSIIAYLLGTMRLSTECVRAREEGEGCERARARPRERAQHARETEIERGSERANMRHTLGNLLAARGPIPDARPVSHARTGVAANPPRLTACLPASVAASNRRPLARAPSLPPPGWSRASTSSSHGAPSPSAASQSARAPTLRRPSPSCCRSSSARRGCWMLHCISRRRPTRARPTATTATRARAAAAGASGCTSSRWRRASRRRRRCPSSSAATRTRPTAPRDMPAFRARAAGRRCARRRRRRAISSRSRWAASPSA
jgi:hypothetical protein